MHSNRVIALFICLAAGCNERNPLYCESDETCQDVTASRGDADNDQCHPLAHGCYPGCRSDADCQNTELWWHQEGWTVCYEGDCIPPRALGESCDKDNQCDSEICADNVCCDRACDGECESCAVSDALGECRLQPAGTRDDSCLRDAAACQGACSAEGNCEFPGPDDDEPTRCAGSCTTDGDLAERFCDGAGGCDDTRIVKNCTPGRCRSGQCHTDCVDHQDCAETSACDRRAAHTAGRGECLDPESIVATVNAGGNINDAIALASDDEPVILLSGGQYGQSVTIPDGKKIFLIGLGAIPSDPATLDPSPNGVAITVNTGATLTVQSVVISGATKGIVCKPPSSTPLTKVVVIDSVIEENTDLGIDIDTCDATFRRDTFAGNTQGGLSLRFGFFVVENSLLMQNGAGGSSGSFVGGVQIQNSTDAVLFNLTILANAARNVAISGIDCVSSEVTATNLIVWDNIGGTAQLSSACSFNHSILPPSDPNLPDPLVTNITGDPLLDTDGKPNGDSPCVDQGTDVTSVLDRDSRNRKQGSAVDIGAFEL